MTNTLKTALLAALLWIGGCTSTSLATARQKFNASRVRLGESVKKADESGRSLEEALRSGTADPATLRQRIEAVQSATVRLESDLQQFGARADRLEEECAATKARIDEEERETHDPAIQRAEEAIASSILPSCAAAVGEARRLIVSARPSLRLAADLRHLAQIIDELQQAAAESEALAKARAELRAQAAAYGARLGSLRRAIGDLPRNREISHTLWGR
jgi:chromosome segregation ATPase